MTFPQPQLPWHDPAWQKQAQAWIQAEAQKNSIEITGEIEQPHIYPWSTVLRVLSNEGTLFFKATAAETVYESALTQKLGSMYRFSSANGPLRGTDTCIRMLCTGSPAIALSLAMACA